MNPYRWTNLIRGWARAPPPPYNAESQNTVPTEIDFLRYNRKCSEENVKLRGRVHVVSCFPRHFMLYRGNFDCFSDRERRPFNFFVTNVQYSVMRLCSMLACLHWTMNIVWCDPCLILIRSTLWWSDFQKRTHCCWSGIFFEGQRPTIFLFGHTCTGRSRIQVLQMPFFTLKNKYKKENTVFKYFLL